MAFEGVSILRAALLHDSMIFDILATGTMKGEIAMTHRPEQDAYGAIAPDEFVRRLGDGRLDGIVVDVREPQEWAYYRLEEAVFMPMQTIPGRLAELPADRDMYVVCAHGVRSAMVCQYLSGLGFDRLINVEGGMAAVSYYKDGFAYD